MNKVRFFYMRCKSCLKQNFYCYGGSNLTPKKGYWRFNKNSKIFFKCAISESCLGENRIENTKNIYLPMLATGECKLGHCGITCQICQNGYGKKDNYKCVSCENRSILDISKFVLGLLIRIILAIHSIFVGLQSSFLFSCDKEQENENKNAGLIKIICLDYFQILIIILNFPIIQKISFLNIFSQIFYVSSQNIDHFFSSECFFIRIGFKIHSPYLKLIFSWIYFVLIFILGVITFNCKNFKISKNKLNENEKLKEFKQPSKISRIIAIFIILFIICSPILIKQALDIMSCINYKDNLNDTIVLALDYKIICYSREHIRWILSLGLITLFLLIIIIPVLIYFNIFKIIKMKKLLMRNFFFRYGYLFNLFKQKYFYWDFLILFRRYAIHSIIVIYYDEINKNGYFPIFFILVILIIGYLLQTTNKPFLEKYFILNPFSNHVLIALILNYFIIILFFSTQCNKFKFMFYFCIFAITTINLVILVEFLFLYFPHWKYIEKFFIKKKFKDIEISDCSNCFYLKKEIFELKKKYSFIKNINKLIVIENKYLNEKLNSEKFEVKEFDKKLNDSKKIKLNSLRDKNFEVISKKRF